MALLARQRPLQSLGPYRLVEKIAEGGMGAIFRAHHSATGQTVAIKILAAKLAEDPTLLQRFEREFRAASQLVHPNIVQALDFGREASVAYLVLEFVEGANLAQCIERHGRLPEAEAVRVITQVAQALQYAHRRGMIHRDVKPGNIMLKADGQAKLTDFGVAKDLASGLQLTCPLSVLGTPHFMAPEQYEDAQRVDARCDIYGLAATLYMVVTGEVPFRARSPQAVLRMQANSELVPPRQLVPELSEAVDRAIRRALSPDPAQRPASCLTFVKDLMGKANRRPFRSTAPSGGPSPKTGQSDGRERRAAVRYPSQLATSCGMETSFHPSTGGAQESWPAVVQDVSTTGVGLVVSRRFEPGAILTIELQGAGDRFANVLKVCVMRVQPQSFGHWLLGCTFLESVRSEELQVWL
ncbi:MAG: protein kinase [Gemmataceae bacterium]|nr:protein kinase [Gemmataceae bacterium]